MLALQTAPCHLRRDASTPDGTAKHYLVEPCTAPDFAELLRMDGQAGRGDGQTAHHSLSGKKHTVCSSIAAPSTCVVLDCFGSSEADD